MPRLLSSMRFKLVLLDWQSLHQFMFHAVCVAACIRSQCGASGLEIAASTIESVPVALFQQLSQHINDVIDFDESKLAVRLVVKPDVDETLDSLKSTYNQLEEILSGVAAQVAPTLPAGIASSLNVVYFPQLGYLIAIRHPDGDLAAMCNDEDISGMKFQFSTSSVAYYKSESMFELDRELGDIHSDIVDRELEIMQQLREVVLQNAEQLFHTARVLTKLECLLALAEAAARFNYVCPTMTEEPIVHIEQGRHPLQELCVETFIANDTHLGCEGCGHGIETVAAASSADAAGTAALDTTAADETGQACPRAMLLTGANFSGKSVYLHQVALITIMAHAGSFVPAASATIGLTDRVLTRIQSDDSVSARKSTFLIDLHQAAAAMHNSSPRSLVVLDEFGKGTTSSDGIGLFCAVLESFVNRGASCPRVIAATHFHEILAHDLLRVPHGSVGLSHMRIIESPSREGTDAVSFLYELAPGRSMQSLGVHCARIAGLPDCINDRAKQVAECVMAGRRIPVVPDERDAARQHAADEIAQVLAECDLAAADLDAALWGPIRRFEPLFE
ncbi:hypothetical protein HK105_200445 [Polyrhizophydium stewartii]|uniref:DNA mismatch repair proteins mutS family domain-containing protein n=1 Tax=Polyrhizophydium stewartii TaxID=2732419 RepID=A0ABR4NLH3_9FUNG